MGRFDALTQIDTTPQHVSSAPAVKTAKPQNDKAASGQADKTASLLVGKTAKPQSRLPISEKPDRYTTRLFPSLVKQIKLYAAEHDMDDKDVVREALLAYFAQRK